jgi:hypothetical protein
MTYFRCLQVNRVLIQFLNNENELENMPDNA